MVHARVLLGSLLFAAAASPAFSQGNTPFSCSVGVTPRLVRTQGYAELAGDIVLTCTGGPTATGSTNLTLFLNTQITSHILNTSTNTSEALLAIDDLASPGVLGV